jgi:alpha-ketoglutarate-dependent taurine dioxygenase
MSSSWKSRSLPIMSNLAHKRTDWVERITYAVGTGGQKLSQWIPEHRENILARVQREGIVLLRRLSILSSGQFSGVASDLFGVELLSYTNRSSPRTELRGKVYTSTEYPPEEVIPQHNENSYSHQWPMKIAFLCLVPPAAGGATPVADSRRVYQLLPADTREKFERKGIAYIRNYGSAGLSWQDVFQARTRAEVESYCRLHDIEYEWTHGDGLRTRQVCPAVAVHPYTAAKVWFNQAHLFHLSNHAAANQQALLRTFGEKNLPRHACYADGEPLEADALSSIRAVYEQETAAFAWEQGDLLVLDNMLHSHGRQPYAGTRKVLVAMAQSRTWND